MSRIGIAEYRGETEAMALDRVEKAWQGEARRRLGNEKRCRALEEKRLAEAMV